MIGGGGAAVGGGETAGRAGWARIESKAKNWTRRWLRLDTDGAYFKVFGDDSEADLLVRHMQLLSPPPPPPPMLLHQCTHHVCRKSVVLLAGCCRGESNHLKSLGFPFVLWPQTTNRT